MKHKTIGVMITLTIIIILTLILMPKLNNNTIQTVEWNEAITILNNGEVKSVMQTHSLDVTLILKNRTTIHTKEPRIDMIFDEIDKCGDLCKNLVMATE